MPKIANNKYYFKAFNDDYRKGGVCHNLDSSELRTYVILQSYCDGMGIVSKLNGEGYSDRELVNMIGLNYRTIKRALLSLSENWKIITVDDYGIIYLRLFLHDNTERDKNPNDAKRNAIAVATQTRKTKEAVAEAEKNMVKDFQNKTREFRYETYDGNKILDKATAEIIENKGGNQ